MINKHLSIIVLSSVVFLGLVKGDSVSNMRRHSKNDIQESRNLKKGSKKNLHSHDDRYGWVKVEEWWYYYQDDDDTRGKSEKSKGKSKGKCSDNSTGKGKGKSNHSSKGKGKSQDKSKGKRGKGGKGKGHGKSKGHVSKGKHKSDKVSDDWYYLDDRWYYIDDEVDYGQSSPSKGSPAYSHPNHAPTKLTKSPTKKNTLSSKTTKAPTKNVKDATVKITKAPSTKTAKATNAPSPSKNLPPKTVIATKAPKSSGGKCSPKGKLFAKSGSKVLIEFEYGVLINDKKVTTVKGVKDLLKKVEDDLAASSSDELVGCSGRRLLEMKDEQRIVEEEMRTKRFLAELIDLKSTGNTQLNENQCVPGWSGTTCIVRASTQLEATISGNTNDSIVCTIIESISNFFSGNKPTIPGIHQILFLGTPNKSCNDSNFSQSNLLDESYFGNKFKIAWWIITIIVAAIMFALYSCSFILRRRRRESERSKWSSNTKGESYKQLSRNEDKDLIIHGKDIGRRLNTTIDVKHCTSALCESCGIESSDELTWTKTNV